LPPIQQPAASFDEVVVDSTVLVGNYKTMTVASPTLAAEGCSQQVKIPSAELFNQPLFNIFFWDSGWVKTSQPTAQSGYDIAEKVTPNRKETITILLIVPADCTKVARNFMDAPSPARNRRAQRANHTQADKDRAQNESY
jgi:hypothetical protein